MPDYQNFEEFYAAYLEGMRDIIKKHIDWAPNVVCDEENSNYEVLPLVSLFIGGCIENAASYGGGAKYHVRALHLGGLPDVANSMIAVRHLVFEEKKVTMAQLCEILQANWEGHEDLRQYVKNTYAYYGNDSDEADELLARLMRDYTDEMDKMPYAGIVRVPAGISTFGRQIDWKDSRYAHAHGFFQGDILAGNISPTPSTDIKGATAVIRSCCKLDFTRLCGGTVLDIRLDPTCVNGDEGLAAIESLLRGFVALGGYFLQVDVLDTSVLLEAQKNPEKYQNLAVRVSGWSARFVTLDDNWQKMVIERTALGR